MSIKSKVKKLQNKSYKLGIKLSNEKDLRKIEKLDIKINSINSLVYNLLDVKERLKEI